MSEIYTVIVQSSDNCLSGRSFGSLAADSQVSVIVIIGFDVKNNLTGIRSDCLMNIFNYALCLSQCFCRRLCRRTESHCGCSKCRKYKSAIIHFLVTGFTSIT